MILIPIVLSILALIVLIVVVGTIFWLPLPFLTYVRKEDTFQGWTSHYSERLACGVSKIHFILGMDIEPRSPFGVFIGSRWIHIHLRSRELPFACGDVMEITISCRHYRLRQQSLNWVKSWKRIDKIREPESLIGKSRPLPEELPTISYIISTRPTRD